ncbi:D-mannose binding lectin [Rathayibacter sp. PhB151]|uniref:hypothetical protein n=1 Tax=Rathayibacter sp. PhB151 TaxID=2485189 RepID=UPI0010627BDE|nr:hypothetical protein [Rathayibacter sp. PhB151]TDX79004.1 D-mannose binding lectin [Rathayibacter sp. PhB151]
MTPLFPTRSLAALVTAGALLLGGAPAWAAEATASVEAVGASADLLRSGERLDGGERLVSPDESSSFVMQTDGNAVVYDATGHATWASGTQGRGHHLDMQSDGNVVVSTADGRPVWATGTDGEPGATLELLDDADLVVHRANGTALWSSLVGGLLPPPVSDLLSAGETLPEGGRLTSYDGSTTAEMQTDGNFVVYSSGRPQWASGTFGDGNSLIMQGDGNAVVHDAGGAPLWSSETAGSSGAVMRLRAADLVVTADGETLWSSAAQAGRDTLNGSGALDPGQQLLSLDGRWRAVMQADGNFVVYGANGAAWATMTSGSDPRFSMVDEGRLTVGAGYRTIWSAYPKTSFGAGQPGLVQPYRLVMQNDGNLVEYDGLGRAVWASRG